MRINLSHKIPRLSDHKRRQGFRKTLQWRVKHSAQISQQCIILRQRSFLNGLAYFYTIKWDQNTVYCRRCFFFSIYFNGIVLVYSDTADYFYVP